ncbi:MAG: hypothetical protein ACLFPF_00900 [Halanaerobiales bacterium]
MRKVNVLDAVERLISTLQKVDEFNVDGIEMSERVLDNRIITLEGYIRFLESEAIPKLERIREKIATELLDEEEVGVYND